MPLGRQVSQWSAVTPPVVETSTRTDVGGTQAKATYLTAHGVSELTAGAGAQGMQTSGYTAEVKTGNVQLNTIANRLGRCVHGGAGRSREGDLCGALRVVPRLLDGRRRDGSRALGADVPG